MLYSKMYGLERCCCRLVRSWSGRQRRKDFVSRYFIQLISQFGLQRCEIEGIYFVCLSVCLSVSVC